MPKKRNNLKNFQTVPSSAHSQPVASRSSDKPLRSVNELLSGLRRTSLTAQSQSQQALLPANTPTVPPAIREILQIPETPPPAPRRAPARQRFDTSGRRLPAGPPPPRSWLSRLGEHGHGAGGGRAARKSTDHGQRGAAASAMPGAGVPGRGSLIDIVLQKIAFDWEFHRVYNQYHLFFTPGHLKSGLIRWINVEQKSGVSIADLRLILTPPADVYEDDELEQLGPTNDGVTYLDLSGSVGRSIRVKEITELLFPLGKAPTHLEALEPQESWENEDMAPSPPRALLPNLTHLCLATTPEGADSVSWKQLLALSSNLRSITHLSLAHWPVPCLTPRARDATVSITSSPGGGGGVGRSVPYAGTTYYSHSLDRDWSEALLVLRILSRSMYSLEYLDLTGCSAWFRALMTASEHDLVDWAGNWGKVTVLRLYTGWDRPGEDAMSSERAAYREAVETSAQVEAYIRVMRSGRGRFIEVERDVLDDYIRA